MQSNPTGGYKAIPKIGGTPPEELIQVYVTRSRGMSRILAILNLDFQK